jgi:ATP-dependent Clp protease, protease subunit
MIDLKRVVNWTEEINPKQLGIVLSEIRKLRKEEESRIVLILNSSGGSLGSALAFYDFIMATKIELTTVALGYVDSAAIIVSLAGSHRLVGPHTSMYLHPASRSAVGPCSNLKAGHKEMARMEEWGVKIIAKRSGLSVKKVRTMMEKITTLNPSEMIKLGLAHELFK